MRKLCVFGLTAFYLLLTTGTYSCLLHCSTEFVFSKLGVIEESHESAENDSHKGDSDKEDEKCGDDCSCCYHHGTYVVNENFSSSVDFQFSIVHIAISHPTSIKFALIPTIVGTSVSWPSTTGPPFIVSQPIYISNNALLI